MYKFESKYIIIMNSNIKQFNTFKTNIEHRYQNISLTVIYIHYDNNCLDCMNCIMILLVICLGYA